MGIRLRWCLIAVYVQKVVPALHHVNRGAPGDRRTTLCSSAQIEVVPGSTVLII